MRILPFLCPFFYSRETFIVESLESPIAQHTYMKPAYWSARLFRFCLNAANLLFALCVSCEIPTRCVFINMPLSYLVPYQYQWWRYSISCSLWIFVHFSPRQRNIGIKYSCTPCATRDTSIPQYQLIHWWNEFCFRCLCGRFVCISSSSE